MLLQSAVLMAVGVPHAFTMRHGGVSSGVFASLNFGNPGDLAAERRDPAANIRANFERVLVAIGCVGRRVVEVHQVHGDGVHAVRPLGNVLTSDRDVKADAIVSDDTGCVCAVRVADCAPVLIASRDRRVVASVHAGWRGVVGGVCVRAIEAMRAIGAQELVAAVGPCIGRAHFEVGPDVVAEFQRAFAADAATIVRARGDGKSLIDLKRALELQLRGAGVSSVDVLPHCTVGDGADFYSHRAHKGLTGRMVGVIGARG